MRDLYTINTDRGRGGSKIPKIRLTSFVHGPFVEFATYIDPFAYALPEYVIGASVVVVGGRSNVKIHRIGNSLMSQIM